MNDDDGSTGRSSNAPEWLVGGGEMVKVVREKDWSRTPLGPIDQWPQSLRTTVSLALSSNFPISIAWGPQRVQIYNDGYWPICGGKHPQSMGQDFKACWLSAWPVIGEAFESAAAGTTAYLENQRLFIDRYGYLEEAFFTFSFSPIRDAGGEVSGLFHPVTETTTQMLAERRLGVLRDVAEQAGNAVSEEDWGKLVLAVLGQHQLDVPFAALYRLNADATEARLAGGVNLELTTRLTPACIDLVDSDAASAHWPLSAALACATPVQIDRLEARFGAIESGPYPEPPQVAMMLPIVIAGMPHPIAVLIVGVSPRRALDGPYRTFFTMLQDAVLNALVSARSYEEEKKAPRRWPHSTRPRPLFSAMSAMNSERP